MKNFTAALEGKKTYILAGIGLLYVVGGFLKLWEIDWHVVDALGLGSIMALRSAISAL